MININYILNGKRKRPKKSRDPLRDLMIKPKNTIIGDRITKPQRRAMKKNPFGDWDKDRVINGLDCQPKNKRKHAWRYNYEEGWRSPQTRTKIKMVNPKDLQPVEQDWEKDKNKIEEIKESGEIREPIKVWNKYDSAQQYQIKDGHHRRLAALQREDTEVPIEIYDQPDRTKEYRKRKGLQPYPNKT